MDCLAKARHPDQLRFGICWQHASEEKFELLTTDPKFRILDFDWRDSLGVCWARANIMRAYQGEDFYLQLDSHLRFVRDWDIKLLHYVSVSDSCRPILTTYGTPFTPSKPEVLKGEPMQMNFDRFTEEGIVLFRPGVIPDWRARTRPLRARFLSAHFLFAPGDFVNEIPYDSSLYFTGEEITLAVRSFTHGYDLFHPPEIIVWHEYTREYRAKHWDDHIKTKGLDREWHELDRQSKEKIQRFLACPYSGQLGCGHVRTFEQYETYAGLNFRHRKVQDYTRWGEEPPNPSCPRDWVERTRTWRVRILLDRVALPPSALDDPYFWYVGIHDANNEEIHRRDLSEQDLSKVLRGTASQIVIERDFESTRKPVTWTVWPYSRSKGWLDKLQGVAL
jgi:hypothetical protein